jgi:hypothetical protein
MSISLESIQARWAYSEIVDGSAARLYDGTPNIAALRHLRENGVPFDQLDANARYSLALGCVLVRSSMLIFLVGLDRFVSVGLRKDVLGSFLVPRMVSDLPEDLPFSQYIETPGTQTKDARNVPPPVDGYKSPTEPLTVGRLFGTLVLLDGYHRAVSFWHFAKPEDCIPAYMPTQFVKPDAFS